MLNQGLSMNSFLSWIVAALQLPKKNNFPGNCMRKYGMYRWWASTIAHDMVHWIPPSMSNKYLNHSDNRFKKQTNNSYGLLFSENGGSVKIALV